MRIVQNSDNTDKEANFMAVKNDENGVFGLPFSDLDTNHKYYSEIVDLYEKNILKTDEE